MSNRGLKPEQAPPAKAEVATEETPAMESGGGGGEGEESMGSKRWEMVKGFINKRKDKTGTNSKHLLLGI